LAGSYLPRLATQVEARIGQGPLVMVALDWPDSAGTIQVRDSKDPSGPVLTFSPDGWTTFISGTKRDEFDL
jgi:hypothetical protein